MEILEIITQYVSIWAPSLVAILGTVATVVLAISKLKSAIDSLKDEETLIDVNRRLKELSAENAELIRVNKLLLDEITKIKDYADHKKEV